MSIDESMIGMKNRLFVSKFSTCYVLHAELHSGKQFLVDCNDPPNEKVIIYLLTECNLLNKGHHIFTDSYYTKLPLATRLFSPSYLSQMVQSIKDLKTSHTVIAIKFNPQSSIYFRKKGYFISWVQTESY